jgi:hypothetical protein
MRIIPVMSDKVLISQLCEGLFSSISLYLLLIDVLRDLELSKEADKYISNMY